MRLINFCFLYFFSGNPSHGDRGEVVSTFDKKYQPRFSARLSFFHFVAGIFAKFKNNFGLNVETFECEKLLIPPDLFSNCHRNNHVIFYPENYQRFHISVLEFRTGRNVRILLSWRYPF